MAPSHRGSQPQQHAEGPNARVPIPRFTLQRFHTPQIQKAHRLQENKPVESDVNPITSNPPQQVIPFTWDSTLLDLKRDACGDASLPTQVGASCQEDPLQRPRRGHRMVPARNEMEPGGFYKQIVTRPEGTHAKRTQNPQRSEVGRLRRCVPTIQVGSSCQEDPFQRPRRGQRM